MSNSKCYIAVGHGTMPNGVHDPGAVAGPVHEYDLAYRTVEHIVERWRQHGFNDGPDFFTETNGGPGHDPDYRGSSTNVNIGGYAFAIEVHYDYSLAPRGGFGLYVSDKGRSWADMIHKYHDQHQLVTRPNTQRHDLWFLNATHCPAVIWECDRVGSDVTEEDVRNYAMCIADGTEEWAVANGLWSARTVVADPGQPPVMPQPPGPAPGVSTEPVPPGDKPDNRPARPYPGKILKLGSVDHANVRAVQQRLHDLGYGIGVDGSFGRQTDGIVRDFQRDQKVGVDGIVGQETWGRLFK